MERLREVELKNVRVKRESALDKISREFEKCRKEHRHYPSDLKARAFSLRGGLTRKQFAAVLGVSPVSVSNWEKGLRSTIEAPRELTIQTDSSPQSLSEAKSLMTAQVRFGGGVEMDFPTSALTLEFLSHLRALGETCKA